MGAQDGSEGEVCLPPSAPLVHSPGCLHHRSQQLAPLGCSTWWSALPQWTEARLHALHASPCAHARAARCLPPCPQAQLHRDLEQLLGSIQRREPGAARP